MANKILILTTEFPPQPGGIGNHAYNLAKGLQANGYNVQLVCDTRSVSGKEEKVFDSTLPFEVFRIPRKKLIFISYLKRIKTAYTLASNNEIVLCSGKFSLWLGAFLSFFFKKDFFAVIHGSEVRLPNIFARKFTNFSLKRFNKIIAVSNYTKSLVQKLNLKNVEVIPNGFEMKSKPINILKEAPIPVLITVGNVTKRKGQHNIIQALPRLLKKFPDLKYHIVGIPTEKERLLNLALRLGVEDAIVFFGMVSEENKIKLLQQADVFVMLSETTSTGDSEGFGIAILEANALGIPAIGALGCGIEDAIKESVSGKLVNNKNHNELQVALEDILNNYETYSRQSVTWSKSFTWDKVISSYLRILKN